MSDRPFDSGIGPGQERGLADLGSQLALVSTDDQALVDWSDTRAGNRVNGKQDLVRALVAFDPSPRGGQALRFGGLVIVISALGAAALTLRRRPPA